MWNASKTYKKSLLALFVATVVLTVLVNNFDYFLGDIAISKAIQNTFSSLGVGWADIVSNIAKFPYSLILLAVTIIFSFLIKGYKAAILSIISFIVLALVDIYIKLFIFQIRPSADLIFVAEKSSSSAFTSTSGMIYAATFGFLLFLSAKFYKDSIFNKLVFFFSIFVLLVIFIARIVLGAHWPSDMIITYMIAFVWIMILLPFISKK